MNCRKIRTKSGTQKNKIRITRLQKKLFWLLANKFQLSSAPIHKKLTSILLDNGYHNIMLDEAYKKYKCTNLNYLPWSSINFYFLLLCWIASEMKLKMRFAVWRDIFCPGMPDTEDQDTQICKSCERIIPEQVSRAQVWLILSKIVLFLTSAQLKDVL